MVTVKLAKLPAQEWQWPWCWNIISVKPQAASEPAMIDSGGSEAIIKSDLQTNAVHAAAAATFNITTFFRDMSNLSTTPFLRSIMPYNPSVCPVLVASAIGGQDCVNLWVSLHGLLMVNIFTLCKKLR